MAVRRASALTVLSELKRHLDFASVLDVGCGVGAWLGAAQDLGATDVCGLDGPWVKTELLAFAPERFIPTDLNEEFDLQRRFDLVISIEVGEHIKPRSSEGLVRSIVRHGDVVLFSAAIPGQGGAGHINEAWPHSWARRFAQEGFDTYDLIRQAVWGDSRVAPWVQQNSLLFIRRGVAVRDSLAPYKVVGEPVPRIHKVTYERLRRKLAEAQAAAPDAKPDTRDVPPVAAPAIATPVIATPAIATPTGGGPIRIPDDESGGQAVTDLVIRALRDKAPLSLIRLSHCEAKFLNWPDVYTRKDINRSLKRQFGYTDLDNTDVMAIASLTRAAVACSDILGIPNLNANARVRLEAGDEGMRLWQSVMPACERYGLLKGAAMITGPNIHLRLQEGDFLKQVAATGVPLTLIGCRDLRQQFGRLGFTHVDHIPVPEAARTRDRDVPVEKHYPDAFHRIVASIRNDRRRGIALVGAGFLGKTYCTEFRLAGGVAVDVGSAMDVWAGVPSRTGYESRVEAFAL